MLVLGLMSGTSADGIDVALVRMSPGRHSADPPRPRLVNFAFFPYPAAVRAAILRLANGAPTTTAEVSNLNFLLGELFARAALNACRRFRLSPRRVALIGSHGQTIYHQGTPANFLPLGGRSFSSDVPAAQKKAALSPEAFRRSSKIASTLQIGEPAVIAERTGITTIADFRPADLAAGGQGAPLVPYVDYLLYRHPRIARLALNIGGIANVTVIPAGARPRDVLAFDTGPGNMVIDALLHHFTRGRQSFDRDARLARRGKILPALLSSLLQHPYFRLAPPKSAGREQFGATYAARLIAQGRKLRVRPADLVRTATLLTPLSILDAFRRWALPPLKRNPPSHIQLILSGGGAHNPLIRVQLEAGLSGVEVLTSNQLGVPEDAKEAFAFAILAYETCHGRPANLPFATGSRHPALLGKIIPVAPR
jgi:anhydro-N-acetylmuramic acid kinase